MTMLFTPISRPAARRLAIVPALLAAALATAPRLTAQMPTGADLHSAPAALTVTGSGEDVVVPDRARISLGVSTQAPTAAEAAQQNARAQQAVLDAVRGLGIAAEQITTSGYNVSPVSEYNQATRRTRITGYSVENTVTVELRRIDQVGPVLDAVLAKGANTISSLQFYSSQAEVSRRRALARAVERARADADAMAAAAGGHVGELLELSSAGEFRPRPVMMAMARVAAAPAATPISEGTETVTATVTARWRFVAGR